ncbi:MAG: 3-oxoacyl-ACP reductase family protein [Dehalococcoidia bacterium]
MRLKGKVAIVTGAASGIGRATAHAIAREGASVIIADINKEGGEKIAEDIRKSGGKALAVKTDISKQDEVRQMVERAIAQFGRVDILVNNAAFMEMSPRLFHETDVVEWKPEIDTTFIGTLLCCRAVIPHMLKRKSGRIISVASDAGKMVVRGVPPLPVYSGCKAAVAGFSRAIAFELAPEGITVNCVSPGTIKTEPMAKIIAELPGIEQQWLPSIPMGRSGEPEDIANMIVFLASDDAKYITGQDYSVNGGMRM